MTNRQKEKIRNAVLYFVTHDDTVGLTKLMKLLFYLDFRTLQAKGRDVTGLVYRTWDHGPVPVDVWRELKNHSNDLNLSSVVKAVPFIEDPRDEPAGVRLRAVHGAKFSDRYFSPAELKELQNVSKMFKDLPASKVVEASHGRKELWSQVLKNKGADQPIDPELAISDPEMREEYREQQEDKKFLDSVFGAYA